MNGQLRRAWALFAVLAMLSVPTIANIHGGGAGGGE